jgi:hypothetical protein
MTLDMPSLSPIVVKGQVYHHLLSGKTGMPGLLTERDEAILKSVAYYRYMTARDLTNLHFAKNLNHPRS